MMNMPTNDPMIQIPLSLAQKIANLIQAIEVAKGFTFGDGAAIISQIQQHANNSMQQSKTTPAKVNKPNANGLDSSKETAENLE